MIKLALPIILLFSTAGCSTEEPNKYEPKKAYNGSIKSSDSTSGDAGKGKVGAESGTGTGTATGSTGSTAGTEAPAEPVIRDPAPVKNPSPEPVIGAPAVRASNGTGGATGLQEVAFTDSTGLASSYKINAPQDTMKVYGLHIHLHGDGGGGYRDFPNKELRYDLIGVSVKAPNKGMTWGRSAGKAHALYLNEVIQNELVKKYNIDLDKIVFSTVSGGSYFITGNFIPEYGHLYKSKAFVMCGGETPRVAFKDPTTLQSFRIHWEYTKGERDDIVPSITASIAAYKKAALGAMVSPENQATLHSVSTALQGPHCEFDNKSYTSGIQQAIDVQFKAFLGL